MAKLNIVHCHIAGEDIATVRVDHQDSPEAVPDQTFEDVDQDFYVDIVAQADRARECAVMIRCADPQHGQKQRLVA